MYIFSVSKLAIDNKWIALYHKCTGMSRQLTAWYSKFSLGYVKRSGIFSQCIGVYCVELERKVTVL